MVKLLPGISILVYAIYTTQKSTKAISCLFESNRGMARGHLQETRTAVQNQIRSRKAADPGSNWLYERVVHVSGL